MALIGPYFDLVEKLWKFYRFCLENHSYKEWLKACHDMMQNFFENAKGHEENNAKLSKAIVELGDIWSSTQLTQPMSANMIRQSLVQMMDKEVGAMGFLQGGITFCKLLPMRNIPIKMACILGLGAMDFPRQHSQAGMDLMGTKFELGDRSARLDDRYLFLETLMSTTDHLHLSYVGQSISDGSTCPPSVVVSELIDFIKNQNGELPIHRHPLQPFSLKYFDGSFPTQSYSLPNLMAAKAMCEESEPLAFYVEELPPVPFEEGELTITCQDLIRFFQHPCRAFVQRRLGIHTYGESYDLLQDSEPFDLGDQLEQYSLKADIYDMLERNESNIAKRLQAKGVGSYGQKGIDELENLIAEVNQILKKVKTIAQNQPEILPVHIRLKCEQGTVVIRDELDQIYGKTQLLKKVGSIKPKEILRALIHHVILNTAQKDHQTTLIGLNNTSIVEQQFIGGADSHDLKTMVEWYLKGLQRPLPFLPDHSLGHKKVRGKSHLSLEKGAERYDEEMEYPDEIYNTCISVGKDVAIRSEQQQLSDSLVDFFIDMFERNSVDG
jgi:exodeoxyribonuclease V gamma subunit